VRDDWIIKNEESHPMMKTSGLQTVLTVILFGIVCLSPALAQSSRRWFLDVETGGVFPGYNNVRIPGNSGTLFSLTEDLATSALLHFRFSLGYQFSPKHTVYFTIAPLSLNGSGTVNWPIDFNGVTFLAGTPLKSLYRFNNYRLTYRYGLRSSGKLRIGLGLTAFVRDASIGLSGGGLESEKANIGPVPLLNFLVEWRFSPAWRLAFQGDAAVAPQGRAEDVLLALVYQKTERIAFKAGYRILEGGADNDEVYNFALFNYFAVGVILYF